MSGTGERGFPSLDVRHTFPRHASISQGQNDRKTREKRDRFAVYLTLIQFTLGEYVYMSRQVIRQLYS